MSSRNLRWFKYEPEKTASGYRWLDLLTDPYWRLSRWWVERRFWKFLAAGRMAPNEARNKFRVSSARDRLFYTATDAEGRSTKHEIPNDGSRIVDVRRRAVLLRFSDGTLQCSCPYMCLASYEECEFR